MSCRKMWMTAGCGLALSAAAAVWMCNAPRTAAQGVAVVPVSVQQEGQPDGIEFTPDQIKQMLEEQGKPAPEHKNIQPLVGTFDAELNFLMEPGGKPEVSKGVSRNRWIMGDKFLQTDFEGTMAFAGAEFPFKGMGILGYDKMTGRYNMMWIDSLSTTMITSTGTPGENAKEISVSGTAVSPMGEAAMTHVFKVESNDRHVLEFWQGVPGQEDMMKVGWITYTRKAD